MFSAELLNNFIDQVKADAHTAYDNYTFIMAPWMHRKLFIVMGLKHFENHATSPMRKIHLRKIAARRKARKRQLERSYQQRYGVISHAS
ncbi:MAG TPA: hypothetical protein VEP90_13135 [Methylomirabilota bacterium]|nr:hypothetical protein [Methylomirabilota bacterium]